MRSVIFGMIKIGVKITKNLLYLAIDLFAYIMYNCSEISVVSRLREQQQEVI